MKSRTIISIFGLLLIASCTKELSKISFEEETIDIGKVKSDTVVDVYFKPFNAGSGTLKIERITTDCHCTAARDRLVDIEPGQTGEIKISYHSQGMGYFEQLIEVHSNAENSPSLLILKGNVIPKEK